MPLKTAKKFGIIKCSLGYNLGFLESCLKTDYRRNNGQDYDGRLYNLLNRYFSGDIKRLPKQYEDFSKTYVAQGEEILKKYHFKLNNEYNGIRF